MTHFCTFLRIKTLHNQLRYLDRLTEFSRYKASISLVYHKSTWSKYETFKGAQHPPPLFCQTRTAGHSKWQNIRHIKAAKDLEKSKIAQKIYLQVKKAVIEAGPNPKYNSKLQQLLDLAKDNSIPKATVDKAINKALNTKLTTAHFEILGPGGSFFIVEVETDNMSNTTHEIRGICRKNGVATVPEGRVKSQFETKGVIIVSETNDNSTLDHAAAVDLAIEAGAEDVQESTDENNKKILKLDNANVEYIPRIRVTLSDELLEVAGKLCTMLEELPEVINIYDNIE
ncbi:translational activator of cytochrome c oxidase 1-like [Centruroides sculpturatus]|uniref:translational activator of cytochrome c oxidase 1-like n=1 Tax=Centruroides sculpturatus TaxID=218467 RepID=UPI000C6DEA0E|nr:translational activator of cytochrome c oxidase 1-like [Centruroides sculpturatus]